MNTAIEILENHLKMAKEQEVIIKERIAKNEKTFVNNENLKQAKMEIEDIEKALSMLRRSYL